MQGKGARRAVSLRRLGAVLLGTLCLSLGAGLFLLPYGLVTGGIPGLALVLDAALPRLGISAEGWVTLLTWGCFLWGWAALGRRFAVGTALSSLAYPLMLEGVVLLRRQVTLLPTLSVPVAAVLGGVAAGVGCGLCFLGGGSTGGTDVPALLLSRRVRGLSRETAMLLTDGGVILLGLWVIGDPLQTLWGILSALSSAVALHCIL